MPGSNDVFAGLSYLGIGRESTYGTYATATAGLNIVSASLKTAKETQILEQIETSRTYSKRIGLGKIITGEIEFLPDADNTATNYIFQNAFGGSVTSATGTGETASGLSFEHTYITGNLDDQAIKSLSFNHRKGDATKGKVFEYQGGRIDELTLACELDDVLRATMSVICQDSTNTSNDISSVLVNPVQNPFNFTQGRLSVETTFAGLTSTSLWNVQSFELGIANSLKSESEARSVGSDTLDILPQGIQSYAYSFSMRFDTVTAYAAMLNETQFSSELEFLASTMTGSVLQKMMRLELPKVFISEAGDPEVSGPDQVLTSDVTAMVLRDDTSATGYALQATLRNLQSSI